MKTSCKLRSAEKFLWALVHLLSSSPFAPVWRIGAEESFSTQRCIKAAINIFNLLHIIWSHNKHLTLEFSDVKGGCYLYQIQFVSFVSTVILEWTRSLTYQTELLDILEILMCCKSSTILSLSSQFRNLFVLLRFLLLTSQQENMT